MATATVYNDDDGNLIGIGYGSPAQIAAAAVQYGLTAPSGAKVVRASRLVDSLSFADDAPNRMDLQRWSTGQMLPDRVSYAVTLIANGLPDTGAPVAGPDRLPANVTAGSLSVTFPIGGTTVLTGDELKAARLGIPDVRAYRLLLPWLGDPGGTGRVSSDIVELPGSLTAA